MLKQLSIFAENKKGTMQQITQILFENDVNILGSVNNDSAEYGIVRMVVSDPDKAEQALQAAGSLPSGWKSTGHARRMYSVLKSSISRAT